MSAYTSRILAEPCIRNFRFQNFYKPKEENNPSLPIKHGAPLDDISLIEIWSERDAIHVNVSEEKMAH